MAAQLQQVYGPLESAVPMTSYHGPTPSPPNHQSHQSHVTSNQPTTDFSHAFNTKKPLQEPSGADWYMDSGATTHLAASAGTLNSSFTHNINHTVIVGNGSKIPVKTIVSYSISTTTHPLALNIVLITPNIVKNLISARKFTKDNWCAVEFDPFGFSMKDLETRKILLRCESSRDLYPLPASLNKTFLNSTSTALLAASLMLLHKRLGHANKFVVSSHYKKKTVN